MHRRRVPASVSLVAALVVVACGSPPNKEMDQAQGALDAAKAAGAERYAATEYSAATTALKNANDAVLARDYRLALNYALEGRERAQNAARETADTKGRVRSEVERSMAEIAALLAEASTKRAAAQRSLVPGRILTQATRELDAVNEAVQEASAGINADDYLAAQATLKGVKERIEKVIAAFDATGRPPQARRRR